MTNCCDVDPRWRCDHHQTLTKEPETTAQDFDERVGLWGRMIRRGPEDRACSSPGCCGSSRTLQEISVEDHRRRLDLAVVVVIRPLHLTLAADAYWARDAGRTVDTKSLEKPKVADNSRCRRGQEGTAAGDVGEAASSSAEGVGHTPRRASCQVELRLARRKRE